MREFPDNINQVRPTFEWCVDTFQMNRVKCINCSAHSRDQNEIGTTLFLFSDKNRLRKTFMDIKTVTKTAV